MPYKRKGKTIYTKATGTWKPKQTCSSIESAKRAIRLLEGLKHGTIKQTGRKKK